MRICKTHLQRNPRTEKGSTEASLQNDKQIGNGWANGLASGWPDLGCAKDLGFREGDIHMISFRSFQWRQCFLGLQKSNIVIVLNISQGTKCESMPEQHKAVSEPSGAARFPNDISSTTTSNMSRNKDTSTYWACTKQDSDLVCEHLHPKIFQPFVLYDISWLMIHFTINVSRKPLRAGCGVIVI